jgi:hypothetical protein
MQDEVPTFYVHVPAAAAPLNLGSFPLHHAFQ